MADIVLINPRFDPTYWGFDYALPLFRKQALLPPLNLATIAALTPSGHTVSIIDENVEPIDFERCARADIVGVGGMAVQRDRMREIILELKERGIFTVLGGPWVTVSPEDLSGLVDVIFVGEAEETWPRFLAEWKEGRHEAHYEQAEKTDMSVVPRPRWDLLPMQKYLYGSMQVSRGCPFTCEFCDIIVVFGRRPRLKTAAQIRAELDGLAAAGMHDAFIVDDNLIGNKKAVKPILREIIRWQEERGYPLSFMTEASIDLAEDDEMIRLMLDANIDMVFVGIESPNEEALRETKKIQNLADRNGTLLEKVHHLQDAGLFVSCGMIVGFDNDDATVFETHRRFLADSRIAMVMLNVLAAIPQTPLFKRLQQAGRLGATERITAHSAAVSTNVIPLRMTQEALFDGYLRLMRQLYAVDAFFDRLDAMWFSSNWLPAAARTSYLRRHRQYRRWFRLNVRAALQGGYVFLQLMRRVPDAALRRRYRRRLWRAALRRPNIRLLRAYVSNCAIHFHHHRLIEQWSAGRAPAIPGAGGAGSGISVGNAPAEGVARAAAG